MEPRQLSDMQDALRHEQLDGWLFYDFRGSDPLAYRILGLDATTISTRRWYYFIPAQGEPVGLVSSVEPHRLDVLPGQKRVFLSWQQLHAHLAETLRGVRRVAMQYSPGNAIPYISRVDAGTIEHIRQLGIEVVSAADLVQRFEAVWSTAQWESHLRAAKGVREIVDEAFAYIREHAPVSEYTVQQFILQRFADRGLTTHHPPIVAINAHSADPHFEPQPRGSSLIQSGDFVLIDLWAKEPNGVYADITWTGFMGAEVPARYREIFTYVRNARDAAIAFVQERMRREQSFAGYEVDAASRQVIVDAGYGDYFVHRTGHSIGEEVHGNGANMDGLETRDERRVLPGTCFSIEPGIYLQGEFGVRSEINIYMTPSEAIVTGAPMQTEVVAILATR
ncbi:MAG: aminopeptidase P family protein [Deltaproteobacteria bacterium]|nr:aminopeptidase P family protein [Deltaproteobacteria bacterium]